MKFTRTSNKPRILLLHLEFPTWRGHRWSYFAQLGIEEGFQANGVDYLTITTPWFSRAQEICAGKKFDQVWIEIVRTEFLDEQWLEWVADLAPIRLGLMAESLTYHPEEEAISPELKVRKQRVEKRLKYMTHVLAIDEKDAEEINKSGYIPAMWWVQAAPEHFIYEQVLPVQNNCAIFAGGLYGERISWLKRSDLKGLLVFREPDDGLIYPVFFDALHLAVRIFTRIGLPGISNGLDSYLYFLRHIRRHCFTRYLKKMQTWCAVVNLPHLVKAYSGRVLEGMAAGRPVISWEIPNRPRNKALFEDGKEILLFSKDDPSQLVAHIQHILSEPEFGLLIAANARRKLKRFHTMEKRVREILTWLETGMEPIYS